MVLGATGRDGDRDIGNRDRRIAMADLRDYSAKGEELRRSTACVAVGGRETRAPAVDEL